MENIGAATPICKLPIMAEIITAHSNKATNRVKKLSTRVDLTPMVDLGFLLITFFIFTTTMQDPKAMKLNTPSKGEPQKVPQHCTMNIMLAKKDVIYAHVGYLQPNAGNLVKYDYNNIRTAIMHFKNTVPIADTAYTNIIIKPSDSASYKNVIDMIDEMTINNVPRYAKVDMDKTEMGLVDKLALLRP
jgi:biopolymer transport protein ExbD